MASQHDNFRLVNTLYGNSPGRVTMLLAAAGAGAVATNAEIVQGMVFGINGNGYVEPVVTTAAAAGAASVVGVAAWTGEANVEPIAQGDECPIVAACPGNIFLAEDKNGTLAQTDAGIACEIDETSDVYTIDKSQTTFPVVSIIGYDSTEDKALIVFCDGPFTGNAVGVHP